MKQAKDKWGKYKELLEATEDFLRSTDRRHL